MQLSMSKSMEYISLSFPVPEKVFSRLSPTPYILSLYARMLIRRHPVQTRGQIYTSSPTPSALLAFVTAHFSAVLKANNLPHIRFHDPILSSRGRRVSRRPFAKPATSSSAQMRFSPSYKKSQNRKTALRFFRKMEKVSLLDLICDNCQGECYREDRPFNI